jgi:hypothetical protein
MFLNLVYTLKYFAYMKVMEERILFARIWKHQAVDLVFFSVSTVTKVPADAPIYHFLGLCTIYKCIFCILTELYNPFFSLQ